MKNMVIALTLIIIGLVVILLPFLGLISAAILSGFLFITLGIGLILAGIYEMEKTNGAALSNSIFILSILALILGIGFIIYPISFAWLVGYTTWILGLFLIVEGFVRILSMSGVNKCGFKDIILGILILLVGLFLTKYIWLLGVLVGLWLLTTGIRMVSHERKVKNEIKIEYE